MLIPRGVATTARNHNSLCCTLNSRVVCSLFFGSHSIYISVCKEGGSFFSNYFYLGGRYYVGQCIDLVGKELTGHLSLNVKLEVFHIFLFSYCSCLMYPLELYEMQFAVYVLFHI